MAENGFSDRFEVLGGRTCAVRPCRPASFDLVVANPPFQPRGQGELPPDEERSIAHHEVALTLGEWLDAAARLVRPEGPGGGGVRGRAGWPSCCWPWPSAGCAHSRLRPVYPAPGGARHPGPGRSAPACADRGRSASSRPCWSTRATATRPRCGSSWARRAEVTGAAPGRSRALRLDRRRPGAGHLVRLRAVAGGARDGGHPGGPAALPAWSRPRAPGRSALAALLVTAVGIAASGRVARRRGLKDPQLVCIDEVAGVLVALTAARFELRPGRGGGGAVPGLRHLEALAGPAARAAPARRVGHRRRRSRRGGLGRPAAGRPAACWPAQPSLSGSAAAPALAASQSRFCSSGESSAKA